MLYDGSFQGLLTAIFEVYEYRFNVVEIVAENNYTCADIFAETHLVISDPDKSERVLQKLEKNLGKNGIKDLLWVLLSEQEGKERLILSAVRQSLSSPEIDIMQNYANADILQISKIIKSVGREKHRMTAFVRFEKLLDGSFFAKIEPDYNVLPLVADFFKNRYQDQKWMIFDLKRCFGISWNLEELNYFFPDKKSAGQLRDSEKFHHDEEKAYQKMWQRYFIKTGIGARKNMKLHTQWMPKRYWKYLTEKK